MEFAMREWLTVIIVLLIVGVLLDGWRRMRQSKRQSIKMSRSMPAGEERGTGPGYGSELPNGGARVVAHRDEDDAKALTRNLQETFEQSKTTLQKPLKIPEQVTLNLDEEVPMLMEPVDEDARKEPSLSDELVLDDSAPVAEQPMLNQELESPARTKTREPVSPARSQAGDTEEAEAEAEEVLVINVMSTGDDRFKGGELLAVVLECGMRYGDMKIFHRHLDDDGDGPLLFSMVNMVVPGSFDLNTMEDFETPGVSLFMTLPMSSSSMDAFDAMAATAKALAERLNGELKDENRSIMTAQTLEHCRARIREFERKRLV